MKSSDDSSFATVSNEIPSSSTKKRKITGRISDASKKLRLSTHELGPDCKCKRLRCFEHVNETQRNLILKHFNSLESNNAQYAHLGGLITTLPICNQRPRLPKEEASFREASFAYKIRLPRRSTDRVVESEGGDSNNSEDSMFQDRDIQVCAKAFCSFHGISKNTLAFIQNGLKLDGNAPVDKRGVTSTIHRSLNKDIKTSVNDHILSFKGRESHYGLQKSRRMYLPEELNVTKIYNMFKEKYPNVKLSYETYRTIFNTEYNISFGYPRTDTCPTCDEHIAKRKQLQLDKNLDELKKLDVEILQHKKNADIFYQRKRKSRKESKQNSKVVSICMDYCKNVSLPNITTNDVYYKRQLSAYAFNIHNLSTSESYFYTYHEGIGGKGSNEVASFLFHFINNFLEDGVDEIRIFCDSCGGQNKNYNIFRFIHFIVMNNIHGLSKISMTFPIRGHSYLECDKNVGLLNFKTHMEIPVDYENLIRNARRKPSSFSVISVDQNHIKDWVSFLNDSNYVKKCPFKTQEVKEIWISRQKPRFITYRSSYNGTILSEPIEKGKPKEHKQLKSKQASKNIKSKQKTKNEVDLLEASSDLKTEFRLPIRAYEKLIPLSLEKYNDIQSLARFCSKKAQNFYGNLCHEMSKKKK